MRPMRGYERLCAGYFTQTHRNILEFIAATDTTTPARPIVGCFGILAVPSNGSILWQQPFHILALRLSRMAALILAEASIGSCSISHHSRLNICSIVEQMHTVTRLKSNWLMLPSCQLSDVSRRDRTPHFERKNTSSIRCTDIVSKSGNLFRHSMHLQSLLYLLIANNRE